MHQTNPPLEASLRMIHPLSMFSTPRIRATLRVASPVAALALAVLWATPVFAQGEQPVDAATLDSVKLAINLMWMLLTGFLVFFMQVGFALVAAGFTRAKSVVHTMMMNLMVFCIAALGYWLIGFALQFGAINTVWPAVSTPGAMPGAWSHAPITLGDWGAILSTPLFKIGEQISLMGGSGFGLTGLTLTSGVLTFFVFQMVFMNTAATIPTGAMAERLKFSGFTLMALFMSMFLYPLIGSWLWGGGWLQNLGRITGYGNGTVDFAGSGVVHMVGGMVALVGATVIGPRKGRFGPGGKVNPMAAHNIPLGVVGAIILFFGWFGFNSGSSFGMTGAFGQLAANAALNTLLAGSAGGVAAMLFSWSVSARRKPDVRLSVNGMLAGLAAITTPCAFVESGSAVFIGLFAGVLCCIATRWLERLRIDDPVGAVPVHLFGGIWGLLSAGIFAAGLPITRGWNGMDRPVAGLLFGNAGQLTAQLIGIVAIMVTAGVASWMFFKILKASDLLRVTAANEEMGLDLAEMGIQGYNDKDATPPPPSPQRKLLLPPPQQPDVQRAWAFIADRPRPTRPAALPAPRIRETSSAGLRSDSTASFVPPIAARQPADLNSFKPPTEQPSEPIAMPPAESKPVEAQAPAMHEDKSLAASEDITQVDTGIASQDKDDTVTPKWTVSAGRTPEAAQGMVPNKERYAPGAAQNNTSGPWSKAGDSAGDSSLTEKSE